VIGPGVGTSALVPKREVFPIIDEEIHLAGVPFQSIHMEGLRGISDGDLAAFAGFLYVIVFLRMDIRVNHPRFKPNEFHDVNLPAGRPTRLPIVPQSPNRRPGAAARRQLGPNFDSPISPTGFAARRQAGGSVIGKFAAVSSPARS